MLLLRGDAILPWLHAYPEGSAVRATDPVGSPTNTIVRQHPFSDLTLSPNDRVWKTVLECLIVRGFLNLPVLFTLRRVARSWNARVLADASSIWRRVIFAQENFHQTKYFPNLHQTKYFSEKCTRVLNAPQEHLLDVSPTTAASVIRSLMFLDHFGNRFDKATAGRRAPGGDLITYFNAFCAGKQGIQYCLYYQSYLDGFACTKYCFALCALSPQVETLSNCL